MKIKIDTSDTKWSKLVRARDGKCRSCGRAEPYRLQAHHIMPRSRSNTRYDLDNGMTLCVLCHTFGPEAVHRIGSKPFMIPLIGKKEYDRLEKLSNVYISREKARTRFLESL